MAGAAVMPEVSAGQIPTIDRAMQLAASGKFSSVNHIRQHLRREGYTDVARELGRPAINIIIVHALHAAVAD